MGALAIADEIRPESRDTIVQLKESKIKSVIITGDNEHTAGFVAKQLGIEEVHASLLPDEKVKQVEQLKQQYQNVAMVGDGVNDAPSLATASVGIAMGAGGSDVAIETADIALMNNNLLNIPYAIRLGKKAITTMKQNIAVSLGIKALFMILALLGHADLQWAIGADSIMAILVILNSLRLFSVQ
jgi:Cd2+/Zn2+-exporting ATPase